LFSGSNEKASRRDQREILMRKAKMVSIFFISSDKSRVLEHKQAMMMIMMDLMIQIFCLVLMGVIVPFTNTSSLASREYSDETGARRHDVMTRFPFQENSPNGASAWTGLRDENG
jgi:hypothetical protein